MEDVTFEKMMPLFTGMATLMAFLSFFGYMLPWRAPKFFAQAFLFFGFLGGGMMGLGYQFNDVNLFLCGFLFFIFFFPLGSLFVGMSLAHTLDFEEERRKLPEVVNSSSPRPEVLIIGVSVPRHD